MATVKRVISNPDEVGRCNSKMSKPSSQPAMENGDDVLTPALDTLAIDSDDRVEEKTNSMIETKEKSPSVVDNNPDDHETNNNKDGDGGVNSKASNVESNKRTNMEDKIPEEELAENNEDENVEGMARQVSVDSSTSNLKAPMKTVEIAHTSNHSLGIKKNNSESTVASVGYAAKDWGWFEDIHDHNNKSPTDDKKGSKKKNQLIPFNEFVNPLHDMELGDIEPKKRNSIRDTYGKIVLYLTFMNNISWFLGSYSSSLRFALCFCTYIDDGTLMAVTAPIYVLEASLSSQKLWKNTAGTRPPQPVEERVFYEKIWAQNFQRSQVDYKIPTDVLTATSPISLSPFSDGNFGEGQSLSGPDDYMGSNTEGTVGLDSETAAVSSVGTFYGSTSARQKTRKGALIGPHNHHHTLVNKKVKSEGTDDELTVLVRGDNVFGTTVSKSFPNQNNNNTIDTVSISIASYRVVEVRNFIV
jgi:hypothetical protein